MISADIIAESFTRNYHVIHRQIDGLTHEDSLRQPPFRGNCLNWVLGHIVASRNGALAALGETPIWDEAEAEPYTRESDPIVDDDQAYPLEKIVADLNQSQERLQAALERVPLEALAAQFDDERTVGERLAFLYWHETIHTGQTEFLRQLAGKNDKVI